MVLYLSPNHFFLLKLGVGLGSNTQAELMALYALLYFGRDKGIQRLQVVGDSKVIVDCFQGKAHLDSLILTAWQCKIRDLQESYHSVSIEHIYRIYNQQASSLLIEVTALEEGILVCKKFIRGKALPEI